MESDQLINVWNEVRISSEGVSITLLAEYAGRGAVVQDETWYTFDELQSEIGSISTLNLSDEVVEDLADSGFPSPENQFSEDEEELPDLMRGDRAVDTESPDWSDDPRVEIVEVTDIRSDEYVIDSVDPEREDSEVTNPRYHETTVADYNQSYDPSEPVVRAFYVSDESTDETYAFPKPRLERID